MAGQETTEQYVPSFLEPTVSDTHRLSLLFRPKGGLGRVDLWSYRDILCPVIEKFAQMLAKLCQNEPLGLP